VSIDVQRVEFTGQSITIASNEIKQGFRGDKAMKAMWLGMAAAVVIAIVAGVIMDNLNTPTAQHFSTTNTRL